MKIHPSLGVVGLLLASLSLSFCKTTGTKSQLRHDQGRFVNHPSPWQWLAVDRQGFLDLNRYRLERLGKLVRTEDEASDLRVRMILKKIAEAAQQIDPTVSELPAVQAIILSQAEGDPDASINAASWDGDVCYRVTVQRKGFMGADAETPAALWLNTASGGLDRLWTPCDQALAVAPGEFTSLLAWLEFHLPGCRLSVESDKLIWEDRPEQSCPIESPWGNTLRLPRILNWISVDTGLLKRYSDLELTAVLAHEVSHFYLAHAVQPKRLYAYFFEGDRVRRGKPMRVPSVDEKGRKLIEASKRIRSLRTVADAIYPPLFLSSAADAYIGLNFSSQGYCRQRWFKDVACSPACNAYQQLSENRDYFDLMDQIARYDGEWDATAYRNVEKIAMACFQSLKFKSMAAARGFVEAMNQQQTIVSWPAPIDPTPANLHEYILALRTQMPGILAEHNREPMALLQKESIDSDLGFYSREVEADELGLEIYLKMGFDPNMMVEAFVKLSEEDVAFGLPNAFGEVSGQDCRRLMEQDWPQRPPIARFQDEHLSPCYRAYNIREELRRHFEEYQRSGAKSEQ